MISISKNVLKKTSWKFQQFRFQNYSHKHYKLISRLSNYLTNQPIS